MVHLETWRTSKLRGSFHKHSCAEDYWVELTASKLDFSQSRGGGIWAQIGGVIVLTTSWQKTDAFFLKSTSNSWIWQTAYHSVLHEDVENIRCGPVLVSGVEWGVWHKHAMKARNINFLSDALVNTSRTSFICLFLPLPRVWSFSFF